MWRHLTEVDRKGLAMESAGLVTLLEVNGYTPPPCGESRSSEIPFLAGCFT